jgi:hypothetical protein
VRQITIRGDLIEAFQALHLASFLIKVNITLCILRYCFVGANLLYFSLFNQITRSRLFFEGVLSIIVHTKVLGPPLFNIHILA